MGRQCDKSRTIGGERKQTRAGRACTSTHHRPRPRARDVIKRLVWSDGLRPTSQHQRTTAGPWVPATSQPTVPPPSPAFITLLHCRLRRCLHRGRRRPLITCAATAGSLARIFYLPRARECPSSTKVAKPTPIESPRALSLPRK